MHEKLKIIFFSENSNWIINILKNTVKWNNQISLIKQYIKKRNNYLTYIEYLFLLKLNKQIFSFYELEFVKYSNSTNFLFNLTSLEDWLIRYKEFYNYNYLTFEDFQEKLKLLDFNEIIENFLNIRTEYKEIWSKLNKYIYFYINTLFHIYISNDFERKWNIISLNIKPNQKFWGLLTKNKFNILNYNNNFLLFYLIPFSKKYKINKIFYFSKKINRTLEKKYKIILKNFNVDFSVRWIYDYLDISFEDNLLFLVDDTDYLLFKNKISLPNINIALLK